MQVQVKEKEIVSYYGKKMYHLNLTIARKQQVKPQVEASLCKYDDIDEKEINLRF